MSHSAWVSLHVFGAVVFLGNLVVTAVWKSLADRTGDAGVIAYAQRLVIVTDVAFTAPGAILLVVSGVVLSHTWGGVGGQAWLEVGLALFAAAAAIWVAILIPIQVRQWRLVRGLSAGDAIPPAYLRLSRLWAVFGSLATLLPLAVLFVMLLKP
jgi:uncharacterized membrane protein